MTLLVSLLSSLLAATSAGDAPAATAPAQDTPPQYPQWSGALALGATWTDGNTESATLNGTFNAQRRGEDDRWTFDLYSNYGKSTTIDRSTGAETETKSPNNHGGGLKYDYFASKKLYLYGQGTGKVDHVADLELRYVAGGGAGYQWKETDKLKWGTEAGVSYVDEDFEDDTADTDFVAARVASNLAWQISQSAAFEQVAEVLPSFEDSEDLIAKVDNRLKLNITGKWIAQLQYVLEFDGSTPSFVEETDHRIVVGIGWSFGS